jgi:hypothetical protein
LGNGRHLRNANLDCVRLVVPRRKVYLVLTIICKYTCHLCGLYRIPVHVPARDAGQHVGQWMKTVAIPALCEDHAKRSPLCHPKTLAEMMIPVAGADYIGGPVKQ